MTDNIIHLKPTSRKIESDPSEAIQRTEEIADFVAYFPPIAVTTPLPALSWEGVSRQLQDLALTRRSRGMVHPLIVQLQEDATWRTPEMLLRQILIVAGMVMDPEFSAESSSSDGEASMS